MFKIRTGGARTALPAHPVADKVLLRLLHRSISSMARPWRRSVHGSFTPLLVTRAARKILRCSATASPAEGEANATDAVTPSACQGMPSPRDAVSYAGIAACR